MRASSPTGVCHRTGFALSRLAACPPLVRRGGIYPSRGCLRRRGVRRDEGIPPYGHFIGFAYRESRVFPARGTPCRGGFHIRPGCSQQRGVRRDEGIPPYGRFIGSAYAGKAACFRREECHVGADSISARGVRSGAGVAGRCKHRPLQGFVIARRLRFPGWPRALPLVVGEGFIPPAGVRGGAGRADMESAPTGGCSTAGFALSRLGAGPPLVRRGGTYPSRGCSRRRRVRRDEGIPPYGRFIGSAYAGKAACFRRGKPIVGADSISARGVRSGAGVAGRCEHRPLQGFVIARRLRFPGWPRARRWS